MTPQHFKVEIGFSVTVDPASASHLKTEIEQILQDLGLADKLTIEFQEHGQAELRLPILIKFRA
jgi:hypothetical protein